MKRIPYAKTSHTNTFIIQCCAALNTSERLALTAAELRFYTAIRTAMAGYNEEMLLGHPVPERCLTDHQSATAAVERI